MSYMHNALATELTVVLLLLLFVLETSKSDWQKWHRALATLCKRMAWACIAMAVFVLANWFSAELFNRPNPESWYLGVALVFAVLAPALGLLAEQLEPEAAA